MMDTFEIFDELLKKPNDEVEWAILALMIKKKLDSHKVFDLYMKAIEYDKDDLKDRLIESNTSIFEMLLISVKSRAEHSVKAIHRALYNLNQSNQFNMQTLNEKYKYNEDEDKKLSWYWREHNNSLDNYQPKI